MFGTLRRDSRSNNIVFLNHEVASSANRSNGLTNPQHIACNKCRTEKLRCSGEKSGCGRCIASTTTCVYAPSGRGEGSKRQRQRPKGSEKSQRRGSAENEVAGTHEDKAKPAGHAEPSNPCSQPRSNQLEAREKDPSVSSSSMEQPFPQEYHQHSPPTSDMDSILSDFAQDVFPQTSFSPLFSENAVMDMDLGCGNTAPFNESLRPTLHEQRGSMLGNAIDKETSTADSNKYPVAPWSWAPGPLSPGAAQPFRNVRIDPPGSPIAGQLVSHMQPFDEDASYLEEGSPEPLAPVSFEMEHRAITDSAKSNDCNCFQETGSLLSDLELHRSRAPTAPLDYTLHFHKSALTRLNALVSCHKCRVRTEFLVFLGVVCEKLTALCESMLSQRLLRQPLALPAPKIGLTSSNPGEGSEIAGLDVNITSKTAYLGNYEINSVAEWQLILKVLVRLQLNNLHACVNMIKTLMIGMPNGSQHGTFLVMVEKRLRILATKSGPGSG